jgi:hypothetical protein
LATALENNTVRQTLVKTVFLQREFGIRAGRYRRSRRASHMTKTGTRVTLTSNRAIFAGRDMYEMELVSVLYGLSASSLTDPEHENQRKDVREHPNR